MRSAGLQATDPTRAFTRVAREDWPAVKGYYRLIDQPEESEVTPENLLAPHRQRTRRWMQAQSTVLCIADGPDVNFTTRPQSRGLGVIGSNQTGAQSFGLHLHSTLAVSAEGLPKTQVVHVVDREADFHELFAEQQRLPAVDLVVRAKHDRRLPAEHERLFKTVRGTEPCAQVEMEVSRQSARAKSSKRQARIGRQPHSTELTLRCRRVEIARDPSVREDKPEKLPVTVVHAVESAPPDGEKPIEWFVLTTLAVDSAERAAQILRFYSLRWRIEDWHRLLPPRPGGPLALLAANPGRDLVFCAHTGSEGSASFARLFNGSWVDTRIRIPFWRLRFAEIPVDPEAQREFLYRQWDRMNAHLEDLAAA